jgi:Flp pilus assembly protein TadD
LRSGAMACAVLRDQRAARALALRAVQLDPLRWEVAAQTGLALAQRGRFGEGVRLLERAAEVSKAHHRAELMLAQGTLLAGRLREAAEALDRSRGR